MNSIESRALNAMRRVALDYLNFCAAPSVYIQCCILLCLYMVITLQLYKLYVAVGADVDRIKRKRNQDTTRKPEVAKGEESFL